MPPRPQAPKSPDRKRRRTAAPPTNPPSAPASLTPPPSAVPGLVVRSHGLWYEVRLRDEERTVLATMRGQLKRDRRRTDIVAVGDHVWVTDAGADEAAIEAVEPRNRVLARTARHTRDTEQVILANLDQALFVFAVAQPEPHTRMLDRFLILAELQGLPAIIGVSKTDLDAPTEGEESRAAQIFGPYEGVYPVIPFSSRTGEGIDGLREYLRGKITAIAGPSGVGKSSLLNVIDPEPARAVGEISAATGKGRHTTTAARLYEIEPGTFVADTPGMRSLAMHAVPPEKLDWCYREFRPFLGGCQFQDCRHLDEPGCAVIAAVERGEVARERYESYAAMRRDER